MTTKVTVVDYGSGNLLSVTRAIEFCGAEVELTDDPLRVREAARLVLPGVGAFADGMAGLRDAGLTEPIRAFTQTGRPFLGICLGMQMLASVGEEFGHHPGLDLIPGRVAAISDKDVGGAPQKIPHIGWADLKLRKGRAGANAFGICEGDAVYLVHSYAFEPDSEDHHLADCFYGGLRIAAAVQSNNVMGFQFHPEKSGKVGLRILNAFLKL
jgi:glutamine amidotransferase